jgi:hypothetical protein
LGNFFNYRWVSTFAEIRYTFYQRLHATKVLQGQRVNNE